MCTYDEISEQHANSNLSNARHVHTGLFLNCGTVEVPEAGEIDAHHAIAEKFGRYLELLGGHATNDNVTEGEHVLELIALKSRDLVSGLTDAFAAGEELNPGDVDRVHLRAVVGQQCRQGTAVDFAAVDDSDRLTEEAVARRQDRVVDLQMLERLDEGQRRARQDGLLLVRRRIEEADVMIHVVNVLVAETLHVLVQCYYLLDVSVVGQVVFPDGIVDDDAVDSTVLVGRGDFFL